jgi:hypothetical protein
MGTPQQLDRGPMPLWTTVQVADAGKSSPARPGAASLRVGLMTGYEVSGEHRGLHAA